MALSKQKCVLPVEERFEFIDNDALQAKIDGLKNKNITKADAKAEKKFVTYLKKKAYEQDYWLFGE